MRAGAGGTATLTALKYCPRPGKLPKPPSTQAYLRCVSAEIITWGTGLSRFEINGFWANWVISASAGSVLCSTARDDRAKIRGISNICSASNLGAKLGTI